MTKIEWCDDTWNFLVGCSRVPNDPACEHCYAATAAKSARLQQFPQYKGVENWDGTVNFVESSLHKPLHWRTPRRVFTCSMSDVFHPNVPDEWRDKAFAIMAIAKWHTYQVLTKRTQRMVDYLSNPEKLERWARVIRKEFPDGRWEYIAQGLETKERDLPFHHIWTGTTAGCQATVDERLPIIAQLTQLGWTTFVSAEPLTEEVNLKLDKYPVHQVIAGAESGISARAMDEDWVRSIRDQCQAHGVAFFYKQNFKKGKKISLPHLDGRQWTQFPVNFSIKSVSNA